MKTVVSLGGFIAFVEAHMIMNAPVPYGRSSLNNSPLFSDGSDFPCKQRPGLYALEGASNTYALGSVNPLNFIGTAVHGGGSCQVSITYDKEPTENSVWKVITSIEGGCPAQGQTINMGEDASAPNPYQYEFSIPSNIPTGKGTIAWTWFNKVGNREMYMNCGPLTLTGTSGSQRNFDRLPDMFRANIGNDCYVPENADVAFPHPGEYVTRLNGATNAFQAPTGLACDSVASPIPTSTFTDSDQPSGTLTFSERRMQMNTHTSEAIEPIQSDAIESVCTEGYWNCIDPVTFQRCVGGTWSVPQKLALGVFCSPGISSELWA
ncbi:hypothetical protein B0I35DRAFT_363235 [Stachybotrys elegans]|uniref:Chitin-binding type-4 domain-containing protein n=1 Tax=Stachybotrys elegans TaxID=80388 RepID=A0A8K0SCJ2_9HYPO|nr:hypothetical protein B0I35DRAFT_363235 [Stachybotrys elegans]